MSLPPIIAFAPHDWNDRWLSRQQLLSRLAARGWPVLYCRGPLSLWDRQLPVWRDASWRGGLVEQDGVTLDRPGRWPPRWPRVPLWDRCAITLHARRLRRFFQASALDGQAGTAAAAAPGPIVWLFHPMFVPYLAPLAPRWIVYHVYDVFSLMDDWTPAMGALEQALVDRADLITASSEGMAANLPEPGPTRARVLHNGADVAAFLPGEALPCPADLAAIPRPRIGYIGTINAKIDLEMVRHVAQREPDWHWVFIGPVMVSGSRPRDREAKAAWEACLTLPNVHALGAKPRQEAPNYLAHMDVNAICYRIRADDWVAHGYPVKLHECLAAGPPVVAAAQEAVRRHFSRVAEIPTTDEGWREALGRAIAGQGRATADQRRAVARQNSWEERTDRIEGWLREMMRGDREVTEAAGRGG